MILLQANDGQVLWLHTSFLVLPAALWDEHYWPHITDEETESELRYLARSGFLPRSFWCQGLCSSCSTFLIKIISFSLPREDEPKERNSVLGTRKERQQIRVLGRWLAIRWRANREAVYPGRERQKEWGSAGHSEAQSQEISGNSAGQQSCGKRAAWRLFEFGPPETHGKLAPENSRQGDRRASFGIQCLERRRKGRGTLATPKF